MVSLPVNVINLICEYAAQDDEPWHLFFSPKNHETSFKVNKFCKKNIENGVKIFHKSWDTYMIGGILSFVDLYGVETNIWFNYKGILFQLGRHFRLYVEFDSENNENKQGKYIYRTMLNLCATDEGGFLDGNDDIYLNGTLFGIIKDGWYTHEQKDLVMFYEKY